MQALTTLIRKTIPAVAVAVLATAGLSAQPAYQAFVKQFDQAMKFDDQNGMDRAVRSNSYWVTFHYEAIYRQWMRDKSVLSRKQTLNALEASFGRVFETDTLVKIGTFFRRLDMERAVVLDKANQDWYMVGNQWTRVVKAKRRADMEKVIDQSMTLARKFEEINHALNAADVWANVQTFIQAMPDPTLADKRDEVYAITRFIENRKAWGWTKDGSYYSWVNWLKTKKIVLAKEIEEEEKRKKAGFKEQASGPEAYIVPGAKDDVGKLEFKALRQPVRDHFFRGGLVPALWMVASVGAEESGPAQISWYRKSDVFLVRPGISKFGVTVDGGTRNLKKNKWQKVDAPNKIAKKPSVFYVDKDKKQKYAMWFFTGGDQEAVCGLTTNLAPQPKKSCVIYYRSAASWVTTLKDVKITFLDDNSDGKIFSEDPFEFGLKERVLGSGGEEVLVPAYDSMIIGKAKPRPYSSWVKLGEEWFHLRKLGEGVGARPVHTDFFKVGTLQMRWLGLKKVKPQTVVMRGRDAFASAAFDIAGGKPVEVPVGEYTVTYGRIVQGKGARMITAHILQGDSEPVQVKEGENTVVELGAPFKVDFEWSRDKGFVAVDSLRFKIKGKLGEHYTKINGAPAAPEVLYGKTKDGKGARVVGEFILISNADMLNKADKTLRDAGGNVGGGFSVGFFAVAKGDRDYSTKLKFLPKFPDGHVGLRQKKHKLFGKLGASFK